MFSNDTRQCASAHLARPIDLADGNNVKIVASNYIQHVRGGGTDAKQQQQQQPFEGTQLHWLMSWLPDSAAA
jgi:hypothetical protein